MKIQALPRSSQYLTSILPGSETYMKNLRSACILTFVCLLFSAAPTLADIQDIPKRPRFNIDGERLIFNGDVERDGYDGIDYVDAQELRKLLRDNPNIKLLELNSDGGVGPAALEMAVAVKDSGIDTLVTENCVSACTLIFLAGENRMLARGARLGFHSGSWARDNMKDYYDEMRESNGWLDEFAFASWAYEEGVRDFNKHLEFMVSRGVDIQFIIRISYVNFYDVWYPTRDELVKFGVIYQSE
jgi:hypothetical protein